MLGSARQFDLALFRVLDTLATQQVPSLAFRAGPAEFERRYPNSVSDMLPTAMKCLKAAQTRYKRDHDTRLRRPLPEEVVSEDIIVEGEWNLRGKESSDENRMQNKLAPSPEGPFRVLGADSSRTTVMRDGQQDRV